MEDEKLEKLVAFIKTLPQNTELQWGDDAFLVTPLAHRGSWIDVVAPVINDALGWNFSFVVLPEGDYDARGAWPEHPSTIIAMEPDCTIWASWDGTWFAPGGAVVTSLDATPNEEQLAALAGAQGQEIHQLPGWRNENVSKLLSQWCKEIAGRADITFTYNSEILSKRMQQRIEEEPEGETYLIGEEDGIQITASSSVMDTLLALDGDEAGELIELIKNIVRNDIPKMGM